MGEMGEGVQSDSWETSGCIDLHVYAKLKTANGKLFTPRRDRLGGWQEHIVDCFVTLRSENSTISEIYP